MSSRATDTLLARLAGEVEERQTMMDGLVESAQREKRDLTEQEMELVTRARDRIQELEGQMGPLAEAREIASKSGDRLAQIARFIQEREGEKPREVEYRSAGAYVMDRWQAGLGHQTAVQRLDLYHRAAAHQTTGDNPGLIPEAILGPVINFVDASRPLVTVLGVRQLPAGSWQRPRVTQHTQVGEQTSEKSELVSRKMVIGKIPVNAVTYGGYVNVSRQNIDWSQPAIMDIIIGDLAAQYALETEQAAATDLLDNATSGPTIGANPTPEAILGAMWAAAGAAFAATQGQGRLVAVCSPDALGVIGQVFPPLPPTSPPTSGLQPGDFGSGVMGQVGGIPVVMSAALPDSTLLLVSTAAAEVYEDRIGALQVVEPSVLGVQVAYAGYFAVVTIEDGAVIQVTLP